MVYGIIGMINFAHGEISILIGGYVGLVTLTAIGVNGYLPLPVLVLTMIVRLPLSL